jgi:hypothetical protein
MLSSIVSKTAVTSRGTHTHTTIVVANEMEYNFCSLAGVLLLFFLALFPTLFIILVTRLAMVVVGAQPLGVTEVKPPGITVLSKRCCSATSCCFLSFQHSLLSLQLSRGELQLLHSDIAPTEIFPFAARAIVHAEQVCDKGMSTLSRHRWLCNPFGLHVHKCMPGQSTLEQLASPVAYNDNSSVFAGFACVLYVPVGLHVSTLQWLSLRP